MTKQSQDPGIFDILTQVGHGAVIFELSDFGKHSYYITNANLTILEQLKLTGNNMLGKRLEKAFFLPLEIRKEWQVCLDKIFQANQKEVHVRKHLRSNNLWVEWYFYAQPGQAALLIQKSLKSHPPPRMQENAYVKLVESIPYCVFFKDKDFKYTWVNQQKADIHDTQPEEMLGKTDFDYFPPITANRIREDDAYVIYSGNSIINQERNIHYSSGKKQWALITKLPTRDGEGKITGLMGISTDITKQKHIEEALWESEEKFRSVVEHSHVGIFTIDNDYRFNYANHELCMITGYSFSELLGEDFRNLLDKQYLKLVEERYRKRQRGEDVPGKYRIHIVTKNGGKRLVQLSSTVIKDLSGKVYTIAQIMDITDEEKAHDALKESEKRFKDMAELLPQTVFEMDRKGNFTFVNENGLNTFGYTKKDLKKRINVKDIISPKDHPKLAEGFKNLITGNGPGNIEYKGLRKNGGEFQIEIYTAPVKSGKQITGLRGLVIDVTERKRVQAELKAQSKELKKLNKEYQQQNKKLKDALKELCQGNAELQATYEKLQESEKRFRQLADHMNDIFWLREKGEILFINQSFSRVWGISPDIIIKSPDILHKWIHPDDKHKFYTWIDEDKVKPNTVFSEQYRIIQPNGNIRWIWARLFPILDSTGKIYRTAGIATDITSQKNIEKALKEAKEKAEESDRLKTTFLANFSHEVRTPLNAIMGFSQILEEESQDHRYFNETLKTILNNSIQLQNLIDDILDIAKIESRQLRVNIAGLDVKTLVKEIIKQYQTGNKLIQEKNLALTFKNEDTAGDYFILTDKTRLKQILVNLLDNAIKYTEQGKIELAYEHTPEHGLLFKVTDTGIGVDETIKPYIFDRFRQGQLEQHEKSRGTGLGLAISKGLVELLGGNIWFASETGKGTSFYFSIPYKPAKRQKEVQTEPIKHTGNHQWNGLKVLIVEDNFANYKLLETILKKTGIQISHADNGQKAIEMGTSYPYPDIILMDIQLPKIDGYTATGKIRQKGVQCPIIAQTAYAMTDDKNKALVAGCDAYLAKPIRKNELLETMQQLLTKKIRKNPTG